MSRPRFHVKKGDEVRVISGNHRGAEGKVLQVLPKKEQVLIEGVRLIKKTQRKSQDSPNGAIITREGPIHISNVKIVGSGEARASKPARKGKE
jgi:large subunit ribosomal protein L24